MDIKWFVLGKAPFLGNTKLEAVKFPNTLHQKGRKKKIARLRSKKIKRIYRLQYKSSAKHMTFYIRTYSKKGKRFRYSRFAVIKI